MYNVYQHWDPLRVCVVGRSYPPEFYSWIKTPHVRELFERIAIETEEDFQAIVKKLESFGVKVIRPTIPSESDLLKAPSGRWLRPPMTPRDYMVMMGDTFYYKIPSIRDFYSLVKDDTWPRCETYLDFCNLPLRIREECIRDFDIFGCETNFVPSGSYDIVIDDLRNHDVELCQIQENRISNIVNGASVARIGKDLYFGTMSYNQNSVGLKDVVDSMFTDTRNHIVNTGGHADGTYCPITPGLIISLCDVPTYRDTYPDWEVIYLPNQSWAAVRPFMDLKNKNQGKWWIPGFEYDQSVIDTVETWLNNWVGYVEETVFDVNMLIIDPKNVMVFNYNKQVFDALDRYGITPHVVPFRHRYFWDGGVHCVTTDLHREGVMQDFFPERDR